MLAEMEAIGKVLEEHTLKYSGYELVTLETKRKKVICIRALQVCGFICIP